MKKTMIMVRMQRWIPLPKILLVSGMGEDSTPFLGLLDAAGCNYRQVSAVSAPDTLKRDAAVQEHHSGKCVPDRSAGGLSKKI